MESDTQANPVPLWYVGLRDSNRMLPITEEVLRAAQSANVRLQFGMLIKYLHVLIIF
jgi:hypothetical protein